MYTLSCISLWGDQKVDTVCYHKEMVDTVCYHKEMNENINDGKKIKWLWLQQFIYFFVKILLNQIKPTVLGH